MLSQGRNAVRIVLPDGKEKEAVIAVFQRTVGIRFAERSFCGKKANNAAAARREGQL